MIKFNSATVPLLATIALFLPNISVEGVVTCTEYPTDNGFGIEFPCGYENGLYGSSSPLEPPTELTSGSTGLLEVTLEVKEYTLDATMFSIQSRSYCHNSVCGVVGPTLRVKPGDTLKVTLENSLTTTSSDVGTTNNDLRHPDYVNVHTHGLHIDPAVDNVIIKSTPGQTLVYEYTIPDDHMAGTHWYHSHVHGASALQVMGGLLGAIIVEPSTTDSFPTSYTAMAEHLLVFSHVSLCSCNPTKDPFRIVDYQELHDAMSDPLDLEAVVGTDNISDVYLTNGQYQPTLTIQPGEWVRLEMINAVGDTFVEIELRDALVFAETGIADNCQLRLLALDGVFLFNGVRTPKDSAVLLNPASRASIAVMCSTTGTRYLQTNPMNRACDYEMTFFQNLLTVVVAGSEVTMTEPSWTVDEIARPFYLQDLTNASPTNGVTSTSVLQIGVEQTGTNGLFWLGVGTDCELACDGRDCEVAGSPNLYGSCPHIPFGELESDVPGRMLQNYPYRHVGKICDVEDMVIQGRGRTPHPMHIHVNHFQVIEVNNADKFSDWGEVGDWRDTIGALTGTTRIRYVLDKYGGNIMIHCHFLYHEDQGMMDRIWVEPATASDDLRCTATAEGSVATHQFCDLTDSEYSFTAYNDAYPSIESQCSSATVACTAVDTPTLSCLVQLCTTDVNTPYVGCEPALCTTDDSTPYSGCVSNPTSAPTPAPTPALTSDNPDSLALCFSPYTIAIVRGKEGQVNTVTMEHLHVGDMVLTGKGGYQMVYSIDHRNPTKFATFLQISYENKGNTNNDNAHHALYHATPLEISRKHMMFVKGKNHPVPADTLRVGDLIQTVEGFRSITIITSILRKGLYNPLTSDGTIVASGIVASTYAAFGTDVTTSNTNSNIYSDGWLKIGTHNVVTYQDFFDAMLKPYQYLCTKVLIDQCSNSENGKVPISEMAHNFLIRWQSLSQPHQHQHFMTFLQSVSGALIVAFVLTQGWLWKYAYGIVILAFFTALSNRAIVISKHKKNPIEMKHDN